jgi:carboxyl-terminal processing protease
MTYKNTTRSIIIPLIIAISIIFGLFAGRVFTSPDSPIITSDGQQVYGKLDMMLRMIENNYVDTVDTKQMVEDAIPSLLKKLDPHTVYIPADDFDKANEGLRGNFGGVGIQFVMHKDSVTVVKVVPKGPSERAGLIDGDRIVKVNDTIVSGIKMNNAKIMTMMRGESGTKVNLTIKRKYEKKLIVKTIERGAIPLKSVDVAYIMGDSIAYIKINKFAMDTYNEFVTGLEKVREEGMKKLIIDLRGNLGGFLGNAINMVNEFLPNQKLIVYTKGKSAPRTEYFSNGKGNYLDLPIAVLIDEDSASASEVFAGAIQDNDRGFIVGRRSFGKGLVQEQRQMPDGSAIRLTVARYYSPSGRCIQKSYENGKSEYYSDISKRYAHGEFSERDSIHQNDSLKYETSMGRSVYGGGGIMPDAFVALDTLGYTPYLGNLARKSLIYRFSFAYADDHRKDFAKLKDHKSIVKYLKTTNALRDLLAYADSEGVKKNNREYKISKEIIQTRLYAYIARNFIDDEGFYPILADLDTALQKAYILLKENQELK